jgi:hypothetical protein
MWRTLSAPVATAMTVVGQIYITVFWYVLSKDSLILQVYPSFCVANSFVLVSG